MALSVEEFLEKWWPDWPGNDHIKEKVKADLDKMLGEAKQEGFNLGVLPPKSILAKEDAR